MPKLGKQPATSDERDITLASLARGPALGTLKAPPHAFGYGTSVTDWGVLGNDQYGDCVFAGACHEHMVMAMSARHVVPKFTPKTALADYAAVTGFDPSDPSTDQGTNVRDAMSYRRSTGIVDASGKRHTIAAYVSLDPNDSDEIMLAAYNFLVVGWGFVFPDYAMDQFNAGEPWDYQDGGSIEGGHYVVATGRKNATDLGFLTWGKRQSVTPSFVEHQGDEAWALVSSDEMRAGKTVRGFDLSGVESALRELH
jgi:hypothetical protein